MRKLHIALCAVSAKGCCCLRGRVAMLSEHGVTIFVDEVACGKEAFDYGAELARMQRPWIIGFSILLPCLLIVFFVLLRKIVYKKRAKPPALAPDCIHKGLGLMLREPICVRSKEFTAWRPLSLLRRSLPRLP